MPSGFLCGQTPKYPSKFGSTPTEACLKCPVVPVPQNLPQNPQNSLWMNFEDFEGYFSWC